MFRDIKKAFDTIDYKILIKNLAYVGVGSITFKHVIDYLRNRKQMVLYNGICSDVKGLKNRCPPRFYKRTSVISIVY